MKVLLINGSPKKNGNTALALSEMAKVFEKNGVETETIQVGGKPITGCMACGACYKLGKCVHDDIVNEAAEKLKTADGMVVGSPVYYASANGTLVCFLDRLFYSNSADLTMKVGAAVASARRSGLTATVDEINKYFTISGMPVASAHYWNNVHGAAPGEASQDEEGLRTVRDLAQNMSFLMKCIADGKEKYGMPEQEKPVFTNFIR